VQGTLRRAEQRIQKEKEVHFVKNRENCGETAGLGKSK
jgi:hypothetical protein